MTSDGPTVSFDTAVLDLDGTLVDSVYQHVVAWRSAFLAVGMDVPAARIHRAIGMGGDRLVTEVAGRSAEAASATRCARSTTSASSRCCRRSTATEGAFELLEALRRADLNVVVASSGEEDVTEKLLTLVDAGRDAARLGGRARMPRSPSRPRTCWTWPWRRSRASARSSSATRSGTCRRHTSGSSRASGCSPAASPRPSCATPAPPRSTPRPRSWPRTSRPRWPRSTGAS